ncbi:transcriptional regulator [Labrys miyagiensis]|uniref:Transcriptional regulator n=1 Tax=Labrys miyagiensis TaxID=346912 RepID=A0ABQ6CFW2_9HYPH|nr:TetR/AcrR family transcriptional regulator [Labrys miyagiensis]GLS19247.1 transcriptional regulator [Labrys miyagiensis]
MLSTDAKALAVSIPKLPQAEVRNNGPNLKTRQILRAARRLFFAKPYDAVSMEAVATHASVSKGTLYLHFRDKETLFATLIVEELSATAVDLWCQTSEHVAMEAVLTRVARNYVGLFGSRHAIEVYKSLVSVSARFPKLGRLFYEHGTKVLTERLATFIATRSEEGLLDVPDPDLAAEQFLSLVRGSLHLREVLSTQAPSAAEIDKVIASGVRLFLKGYAAPPRQG